jgi:hypothetical protein
VLLRAGYNFTRAGVPRDITDPAFRDAVRRCQPYTATSPERMYALWKAVEHAEHHHIAGDIVECGVWRGGSSMLAALATAHFADSTRRLWLFDTFEGMSDPGPDDVYADGTPIANGWSERAVPADPLFCYATLQDVQANLATTGYPPKLLTYVRGKVEDTLADAGIERVSILRLDTDWYESTKLELELLWERLSPNGVLIIDDYGAWQGARRAVDEFFEGRPDAPLLSRVDSTARVAVKC